MCKNCYHAMGREKLTSDCPHVDRPKYAHGVCKNCYLSKYHRERRAQRKLAAAKEKNKNFNGDHGEINNIVTAPKRKRKSYVKVSARPVIMMTVGELQNEVKE